MKIYNRFGEKLEAEIPNQPIKYILVVILGGDETGIVAFESTETVYFDATRDRKSDDFIDSYLIEDKRTIEAWMNYVPVNKENAVTERKVFAEKGGYNGETD